LITAMTIFMGSFPCGPPPTDLRDGGLDEHKAARRHFAARSQRGSIKPRARLDLPG
jgi:hypothetical protein